MSLIVCFFFSLFSVGNHRQTNGQPVPVLWVNRLVCRQRPVRFSGNSHLLRFHTQIKTLNIQSLPTTRKAIIDLRQDLADCIR